MKKLGIISLLGAFVASSIAMFATSAWALPVFARKYNVQCSLCHTMPPRLTRAGVAFKENGFEMPSPLPESETWGNIKLSEDEPKVEVTPGLPITLRSGIDVQLSNSFTPSIGASAGAAPAAAFREFGLIGGGNLGGVGFWIDAPGAVLGAFDADFKFSDMAKLKVGVFEPAGTINYGLGLMPASLMGLVSPISATGIVVGNRNPVSNLNLSGFRFGNTNGAVELRGTTDATNGMGFNYAVGYGLPAIAAAGTFSANSASTIYGGLGYYVDAINTNFGVSYASTSNIGNVANVNGNNLLATATYNVGSPFLVIFAYTTQNSTAAGVTTNQNGWSVEPEYDFGRFWVAARYASLGQTIGGVASPANSNELRVALAYRFLATVIGSVSYVNLTNTAYAAPTAAAPDASALWTSVEFIF